eukprot:4879031-Amphidinium_carterae.1
MGTVALMSRAVRSNRIKLRLRHSSGLARSCMQSQSDLGDTLRRPPRKTSTVYTTLTTLLEPSQRGQVQGSPPA